MLCYGVLNLLILVIVIVHSKQQKLIGVVHSAMLLLTHVENELQMWEFFSNKMVPCTGLEFRNQFVDDVEVACVPKSVGHRQCLHVGLPEHIFKLV